MGRSSVAVAPAPAPTRRDPSTAMGDTMSPPSRLSVMFQARRFALAASVALGDIDVALAQVLLEGRRHVVGRHQLSQRVQRVRGAAVSSRCW